MSGQYGKQGCERELEGFREVELAKLNGQGEKTMHWMLKKSFINFEKLTNSQSSKIEMKRKQLEQRNAYKI